MAPGLLQSVVGEEEAGNTGVKEFKQGDDFKKMVGDSGGVVVRFFQSGEGVVEAEQKNWKKLEEEWVHKVWDKRVYGMQFVQVDCTMHSKVCEIEVRDEEKKAMRELPIVQVYVKGNKHASIATKSIGYGELDAELKKAAVFKNKEADYDRIITSKAEFDQLVLGSNGKKDGDAVFEDSFAGMEEA
ncbi:hypothetical protein AX774_g7624 [Zancudomyces culisetae]|uniref:Uncharacterized protein n=1 Tax=Zancudomyces culisetae TaxID=1213189 RepID=A0A1R1PDF2_ZANCU|nr:hypothetical protein AX774_g7624 [Zancudomyces culisetae]|eukprot:OMH78971.1 hypothetical protein AX774_g7624 [Zancudomyces culisetae]